MAYWWSFIGKGLRLQSAQQAFLCNVIYIPILQNYLHLYYNFIFKASALWADAFYRLKCPPACPCVCSSVRVFTFEVPFKRLFAPTYRSRMSNIFRDLELLGKSNGKSGLRLEHCCLEVVLNCQTKKKNFFWADFALQKKVETTLLDGLETSGQRAYHLFRHISRSYWVFASWMIISNKKKKLLLGILGPPYCGIGATIRIGREMLCLPYAGFLFK